MDKLLRNKLTVFVSVTILLVLPQISYGSDAYKCVIKDVKTVSDSGKVIDWLNEDYFAITEKEFVVDKTTGKILGNGNIQNHSVYGTPEVLDSGSDQQAYKVLTVFKPLTTIDFLSVADFPATTEMPFFFITGTLYYTGLCRDY